ncbi:formimidoylglutamate deiminase [Burkholderiaceae bacterium UC74_6]
MTTRYLAPLAWVDGRWQREVCLSVDAHGHWSAIETGAPGEGATRLNGPVIPSLVDAHSHAFQRAFAGLAERREAGADDFWSWRDRMYGLALKLSPEQARAIAAQLYVELLKGGYTQVCEFHYLHHTPDGGAYPQDELAMSWALADAAADAGLGLTMLPVLYARSGFGEPGLREDQRRFRTDAAWVRHAQARIAAAKRPLLNAGVALHSLRAANAADITELLRLVGDEDLPIHIHIAEQQAEVAASLAHSGRRPMEWLCANVPVDARWQLVHATHGTRKEIESVGKTGAGVVICPGTEANLGDGLTDLPAWLDAGVPMSLGSDSHVTRCVVEELRWLEYGQRLGLRQRNVSAAPPQQESTAARLFELLRAGGARPAGLAQWGLERGARADFLVLDAQASGLLGLPAEHLLDGFVFATQGPAVQDVFVAGRAVVSNGRHAQEDRVAEAFADVMQQLWG